MTHIVEPAIDRRREPPARQEIGPDVAPRGKPAAPPPASSHRRNRVREAAPPLLVLLSGTVLLGLLRVEAPPAVRAVAVLAYIAVIPGLACVRLVRLPDGLTKLVIGVALSLALGIVVAQTMLYLHSWSPRMGLSTLVAIASLAALLELFRVGRRRRPRTPSQRAAS